MKVYVAGAHCDKEKIGERITVLEKAGIEITHNWTKVESKEKDHAEMARYAELDIDGVRRADVVVIMVMSQDYPYRGTNSELGAALVLRKPVIAVTLCENSNFFDNIFTHHPLVRGCSNMESLMMMLDELKTLRSDVETDVWEDGHYAS